MLFTASNWHDIEKYYYNTYVKFKEFGDKLFFIRSVTQYSIKGIDEDSEQFELYLDDAHPYELDYILPHRATFQFKDSAVTLQRIPARQYRRGLNHENTRLLRLFDGESLPLQFDVLKAYVNKQKYFTFTYIMSGKVKQKSLAMSPRMAFNARTGQLQVDGKAFALVDTNTKTIICRKLFMSDVAAIMSANNEDFVIKEWV